MCALEHIGWKPDVAAALRPVFVYVSHEKTGSNTVLDTLRRRADRMPLPRLNYSCGAAHGKVAFSSKLCFSHYLEVGCCRHAPPNAVVHDNSYGYCEAQSEPGRPCHYFTAIREPLSRIVSAYVYMCLKCTDKNAHCPPANASARGAARASSEKQGESGKFKREPAILLVEREK